MDDNEEKTDLLDLLDAYEGLAEQGELDSVAELDDYDKEMMLP